MPSNMPPAVVNAALDVWSRTGHEHGVSSEGTSMLPLIRAGDLLFLRHTRTDIRRGDVIAFWRGGRLVAHRVIYTWRDGSDTVFLTRGDNVLSWDAPVRLAEVAGRVVGIHRGDRVLRLDGPAWRAIGWTIAMATAACRKAGATLAQALPNHRRAGHEAAWASLARTFAGLTLQMAALVSWRFRQSPAVPGNGRRV